MVQKYLGTVPHWQPAITKASAGQVNRRGITNHTSPDKLEAKSTAWRILDRKVVLRLPTRGLLHCNWVSLSCLRLFRYLPPFASPGHPPVVCGLAELAQTPRICTTATRTRRAVALRQLPRKAKLTERCAKVRAGLLLQLDAARLEVLLRLLFARLLLGDGCAVRRPYCQWAESAGTHVRV